MVPALFLLSILLFRDLTIFGWGHLELLAEKSVEVAAAGETTDFCDKADGVVGVGKHLGSVTDAPVIKEVAEGHAAGTLADGIGHEVIVRAEHLGKCLAVQCAFGIGLFVAHLVARLPV